MNHIKTIPNLAPEDYSPMMQQYLQMKEQCGDAILLFRCGDFYEMFMDDAIKGSEILDIALTRKMVGKGQSVPLAGIPYHAAQNYIYKLTRKGCRVAVCEQTEDTPQKGKKIIEREIARTISPGTVIDSGVIDSKENNYLAALYDGGMYGWGLASVDVTTGEFRATWESGENAWRQILNEIGTLNPSEILLSGELETDQTIRKEMNIQAECMLTFVHPATLDAAAYQQRGITEQSLNLTASRTEREMVYSAANAIVSYLDEHQKETLLYIQSLELYRRSRYMMIDKNTERNLELLASTGDSGKKYSLLGVLDLTATSMGGRLLRHWILRPLLDVEIIHKRQEMVALLVDHSNLRDELRLALRSVHDVERLLGRVTFGNANARDLSALKTTLEQIPSINQLLQSCGDAHTIKHALLRDGDHDDTETVSPGGELLDPVMEIRELLRAALVDEPPLTVREGGMIRGCYEPELDELRSLSKDGRGYIAKLQEEERASTGISSLKVSYNKVFGYYIEVTHSHKDKVPQRYIRKQTLSNAERFITPELKEFEAKVLHAEDQIKELEYMLLQGILQAVLGYAARLKNVSAMIARLDVYHSLAEAASRYHYNRPVVNDSGDLVITEGRHPVVERVPIVESYVPNDTRMLQDSEQIWIITGPNMAGKSTYIRQVALLTLMAQMGSFIPAQSASIGIVDRLFSRVGASDDLARGRSTFMVEMSETATILNHATPKSLIILDEIGRGTSTFDGISLAWAIVEYLHGIRGGKGVKTLFATHYHEIAALSETHKRTVNYHVQVSEDNGQIRFLYRIGKGHTDHSYGIHVADLAGVPKRVTSRARKILQRLERGEHLVQSAATKQNDYQVSLFTMLDEPLRAKLADTDMDTLSPVDAWQVLSELVNEAKKG